MNRAYSFKEPVPVDFFLQSLVVLTYRTRDPTIETSCLWPHNFLWGESNQRRGDEVYHKQPVIPNAIARRHNACPSHLHVCRCPDCIDRFGASEVRWPHILACKLSNHLFHGQSIHRGKCFPNGLPIYVLVGVQAYNQFIPLFSPSR